MKSKKAMVVVAVILGVLILFVLGILIFIKTAPQFGAKPSGDRLQKIKLSKNYANGQFQNSLETNMDMSFGKGIEVLREWYFSGRKMEPEGKLPEKFGENITIDERATYVTWYGHSAILLEIEGKRILIDPMLGPASSPVSFLTKRFTYEESIPIDSLTVIDMVVFSHDHYDHLDHFTVLRIKDRVNHFVTAMGVGAHLERWGVDEEKITELDWWESTEIGGIRLVCTPARHFSGRGISDRNRTQWASWVLSGSKARIYFSGDGGYGPHFTEIGKEYGPFDFAMIECGQYNEKWKEIHMYPEESVQASLDLKAEKMMPIHWGAFRLAPHHWLEPILRAKAHATKLNVPIVHPIIGERMDINAMKTTNWWEGINPNQ